MGPVERQVQRVSGGQEPGDPAGHQREDAYFTACGRWVSPTWQMRGASVPHWLPKRPTAFRLPPGEPGIRPAVAPRSSGVKAIGFLPLKSASFARPTRFGFILFARNMQDADQIRALCDELRQSVGRDAPVMTDHEGGRVQRIGAPVAREWLPPLDQVARAGAHAAQSMYLRYQDNRPRTAVAWYRQQLCAAGRYCRRKNPSGAP